MRSNQIYVVPMILAALIVSPCVKAKDGVEATVHTEIPASSEPGTRIEVEWTLASQEDERPFSACSVFIRILGPSGEEAEAFAPRCSDREGRYAAVVTVPSDGVAAVEIGVAGTMTKNGVSQRSDWLMPLANDPIKSP